MVEKRFIGDSRRVQLAEIFEHIDVDGDNHLTR
jgi:hypothetical protein